jgi:hypothetical protein
MNQHLSDLTWSCLLAGLLMGVSMMLLVFAAVRGSIPYAAGITMAGAFVALCQANVNRKLCEKGIEQ